MSGKLKIARFDGKKGDLPGWWDKELSRDETITPGLMERDVLVEDRRLGSEDEARKAIESEHKAGDKALAISFYTERVDTKDGRKVRTRIKRLESQVETLYENAMKSLKAGKSPRVSCKKCRSSLNREFIKKVDCVMCEEPMMSAQRKAKLEKLNQAISQAKEELGTHPAVPRKNGPTGWLVGGWVRSE